MVNKFMPHHIINYHSWRVTAVEGEKNGWQDQPYHIVWKSCAKPSGNLRANFCEKLLFTKNTVYKNIYSPTFPTHSTNFFTTIKQIVLTIFSTIPHTLLLQLQNILIIKHSERII